MLTGEAANWSFEEKLAALWQVDVVATLRLSRDRRRRMKERGQGVILNMGWDQAETGMAGDSGEMFGADEGRRDGGHAQPGAIARAGSARQLPRAGLDSHRVGRQASAEWQERAERESLLGRWGEPEDVARVACFLASPAAAFINGQIIPINGGRIADGQ